MTRIGNIGSPDKLTDENYGALRDAFAGLASPDVSTDAVGAYAPNVDEIYAPATHASALDRNVPIVVGARGVGKSFWAGVLGKDDTRNRAHEAYPKLGLNAMEVRFGFTGIGGLQGVSSAELDENLSPTATAKDARTFWWATILAAIARESGKPKASVGQWMAQAANFDQREAILQREDTALNQAGRTLLVVFDALDMVATDWPRRRLLTEALLEVVWALRAYRAIRPKLFVRPDQLEDDALRFVELPKLRTGAVRLRWDGVDLYGLLFARLALSPDGEVRRVYEHLLGSRSMGVPSRSDILARKWSLLGDKEQQKVVMACLAGEFMAEGRFGYKKGSTYAWPLAHLADAFGEVTPRSFLGLMVAAATHKLVSTEQVITPDGVRHGLRAASKTRVDQLHQEFPWIKAVLAPLAGLLLPQSESDVFAVWRKARTVEMLLGDSQKHGYLPPFEGRPSNAEAELFGALQRIGVMFRRNDDRLDMPDLFRVAAKLLKKGGTAPL